MRLEERARLFAGKLPHELLLLWAVDGHIEGEPLDVGQRIEAARAAAPYYAPRLTPQILVNNNETSVDQVSDRLLDRVFGVLARVHAAQQETRTIEGQVRQIEP
jgi:hypothetical protein